MMWFLMWIFMWLQAFSLEPPRVDRSDRDARFGYAQVGHYR